MYSWWVKSSLSSEHLSPCPSILHPDLSGYVPIAISTITSSLVSNVSGNSTLLLLLPLSHLSFGLFLELVSESVKAIFTILIQVN